MEQVRAGPGTVLAGRYTLERELGRGGMATVYLALDHRHHRQVAIKILRPEVAASLGSERFLREIRIAACLTHPHILPLHDSGESGDLLYYVMPFVEGESLRERLDRQGRLPLAEAIQIAREVADALAYAHEHGVIHRDIKPGNILLESGHAVVADFGIARAVSAAGGAVHTTSGVAIGTPMYMSPEQISGGHLDGRSDVYSLGCVLYEMLTGSPPFRGPDAEVVVARQLYEQPPSLSSHEQISPAVGLAIEKALAKNPDDRYPDATRFAQALEHSATRTVPRRTHQRRKAGLITLTALAGAGALIVLALVAGPTRLRPGALVSGSAAVGNRQDPDPTHLAVLYFDAESPDTAIKWVASGLTEDLIDQLGQVEALSVVSANGVRPYRDRPIPPDSVAAILSVGTIVTGKVAGSLNHPVVTVRLIEPTGRQVGTEVIKASGGDILALRGELVEKVAESLRQRLGREIKLRELRSGSNADAWVHVGRAEELREDARMLYVAGDTSAAHRTFDAADSLLNLAERLDPGWVEPTLQRGWITVDRIQLADARTEAALARWAPEGLAFAERALARRPNYPPALELRGSLRVALWQYSQRAEPALANAAERDLRAAAVPENPTRARTQSTLAYLLWRRGSFAEANLAARRSYEADAFLVDAPAVLYRLYATSLLLQSWEEARNWCQQGYQRFPGDWLFTLCRLTLLSMPSGARPDPSRAWQLYAEMERVTPPSEWQVLAPRWQMLVATILARAGLPDSARRTLRVARAAGKGDPEMNFYEAETRAVLGEEDRALSLIEQYARDVPAQKAFIQGYPTFETLRPYPRFRSLAPSRDDDVL